jgi:uncharacterized membrane protein
LSWVLDDEVLAVLTAIVLVSSIVAGVQVLYAGRVVEPFSELAILGPEGKISNYPKEVVAGSPFTLVVYVGDHEGRAVYYKVLVKLGDGSSIVNEITPLMAEPIAELRAVLSHNFSTTLPINLTICEPGTRLKLVFELWTFDEATREFRYRGIWNQLWLNVTGQPSTLESTSPVKLSRELESKLADAYLSIRRAEEAGGGVSEMVGLLNQALRHALSGDEASAEALANRVIAMEPEVSRLGMEVSKMRLYTGIGILVAVVVAGVGCFLLLRRRVWIWWARLHASWEVTWVGSDAKLSGLEEAIRDRLASKRGMHVRDVVSPELGHEVYEIAKALYKLSRKRLLRLVDPSSPKRFSDYLLSRYNLGFAVAVLLVSLCLVSIYLSWLSPVFAALRMALGSIFVLFLPGYSLVEALYPKEEDLSPLERLALSIGLSLALVPLVGLLLNYSPWGIRLDPVVASLSTLTLALLLASAYRKFGVLKLKVAAHG